MSSMPANADITLDGSFVGNTPSEIDVTPGDHTLTVSKPGFKPWERKFKATGGSVNINAELESRAISSGARKICAPCQLRHEFGSAKKKTGSFELPFFSVSRANQQIYLLLPLPSMLADSVPIASAIRLPTKVDFRQGPAAIVVIFHYSSVSCWL